MRGLGGEWAERRDRALAAAPPGADVREPGPGSLLFEGLRRYLTEGR